MYSVLDEKVHKIHQK